MRAECLIRHDGRNWIAENDQFEVSGQTIDELDDMLSSAVREKGLISKDQTLEVFMAFDNACIPEWMRQYAQHYFNRTVIVKG